MKQTITTLFAALCIVGGTYAQTPRTVIVEHFTNTKCSICAANNPSVYATLRSYPDVLHISYHPSAPYAACIFSKENKTENDARTNYYGLYGGTPAIAVQGLTLPPQSPTLKVSDITTAQGQFSPFALSAYMTRITPDSIAVRIVVKTTATHSYPKLMLYGAVTEDTIYYTGSNGEPIHFDVFHKQLWASTGGAFSPAAAVGDSVWLNTGFSISGIDSIWNTSRINIIAMVQDSATKVVLQATKQTQIKNNLQTGIDENTSSIHTVLYPNPATDEIRFTATPIERVEVYDLSGKLLLATKPEHNAVSVAAIATGIYFITLSDDKGYTVTQKIAVVH